MCSGEMNGLLRKREDWDKRLRDLFVTDIETEFVSIKCEKLVKCLLNYLP